MDKRIEAVLDALLANIETLDETLLRIYRSDIAQPSPEWLGRLEHVREACITTLQVTQLIERGLQALQIEAAMRTAGQGEGQPGG